MKRFLKGSRVMLNINGLCGRVIDFVNGECKVRWENGTTTLCSRGLMTCLS